MGSRAQFSVGWGIYDTIVFMLVFVSLRRRCGKDCIKTSFIIPLTTRVGDIDINARDQWQNILLIVAAPKGYVAIVRLLNDRCDVQASQRPIHYYSYPKSRPIANFLCMVPASNYLALLVLQSAIPHTYVTCSKHLFTHRAWDVILNDSRISSSSLILSWVLFKDCTLGVCGELDLVLVDIHLVTSCAVGPQHFGGISATVCVEV